MNWINVKDRLPESGQPVLFWHKRAREVYFGSYEVDEWLVGGRHYDASGVTHWQPLPLPPGHRDAAPGEAELVSFAQSAIEEVSDSWMYRATLHAQWACFYCNVVVEWVGDDGDEAVCEHFPGCLHLRARALRDNDRAD